MWFPRCLWLGVALAVGCGNDPNQGPTSSTGGTASGGTGVSGGGSNAVAGNTGGDSVAPVAGNAGGPGGGSGGSVATGGGAGFGGGGGEGTAGGGGGGAGTAGGGAGSGGATPVSCPMPVLPAGDSSKSLMIAGKSRSYVLHVPAAYDGKKPVPLMLDFHGLGGDGSGERNSSPYPAQTDGDGVIIAFPTGLPGPSQQKAWNVGPCCVKDTDDVAFAKALVTEIEKSACVDTKRVYAVGFSMGGGMSHYLACHAADVFAAVAPAAFDLLQENVDDCKPSRPISVISFRSTADPVVAYEGGYSMAVQGMPINFLGAKSTFAKWAQLNQCTGAASAEDANGCASYAGCPGGLDVMLCTKQGGNHEPGNAKVAWPLLKKHALP